MHYLNTPVRIRFYILAGLCLIFSSATFAAVQENPVRVPSNGQVMDTSTLVLLFVADASDKEPVSEQTDILDSLKDPDNADKTEKKCMTVCEKWGEDCVINPRTGTRKCRRTCKKLTQECF